MDEECWDLDMISQEDGELNNRKSNVRTKLLNHKFLQQISFI